MGGRVERDDWSDGIGLKAGTIRTVGHPRMAEQLTQDKYRMQRYRQLLGYIPVPWQSDWRRLL